MVYINKVKQKTIENIPLALYFTQTVSFIKLTIFKKFKLIQ